MGDVHVSHGELLRFTTAIFSATGMSKSDAGTVAEVLVWANERGVDSHGPQPSPLHDGCCRRPSSWSAIGRRVPFA
jgi:LDH2 family malate/lactate/ureidoglycolate dehydrogenase